MQELLAYVCTWRCGMLIVFYAHTPHMYCDCSDRTRCGTMCLFCIDCICSLRHVDAAN